MVNVVLAVAIVGVALLAAAVLTDNTIVALVVIIVAAVGLVLLARDWLSDRQQPAPRHTAPEEPAAPEDSGEEAAEHVSHEDHVDADEFEPDVPYDDSDTETKEGN
jgi:hypothetical protein